jgi:hypothetical protein
MGKHKNDIPRLLAMCRFYRDEELTIDSYIRYLAAKKKIAKDMLGHQPISIYSLRRWTANFHQACGRLDGAREARDIMREKT